MITMAVTVPMAVTMPVAVTRWNFEGPAAVALAVGTPSPDSAAGHRELPVLTTTSS
jgi:hypothetical protein